MFINITSYQHEIFFYLLYVNRNDVHIAKRRKIQQGRFSRSWIVDAGVMSIEEYWNCIILDNIGNSGLARSGGTIRRTCSRLVVAGISRSRVIAWRRVVPRKAPTRRSTPAVHVRASWCLSGVFGTRVPSVRSLGSGNEHRANHRCDDSTKVSSIKSRCERSILDGDMRDAKR